MKGNSFPYKFLLNVCLFYLRLLLPSWYPVTGWALNGKKYLFTVGALQCLAKEPTPPVGVQAAARLQLVYTATVVSPSWGRDQKALKQHRKEEQARTDTRNSPGL